MNLLYILLNGININKDGVTRRIPVRVAGCWCEN